MLSFSRRMASYFSILLILVRISASQTITDDLINEVFNGSQQEAFLTGYENMAESQRNDIEIPEHYKIAKFILQKYNKGFIPKRLGDGPIKVNFSMELYQIIQINEPQQYMLLNAWIAERWVDNLLGWDPEDFGNETQIMIPYDMLWLPDTTLYNSLVMDDQHSRRLLSAKLTTRGRGRGALVELLYPTIYKESCMLDLRFFPFDLQSCKLTFGSWTYDNTLIDYYPYKEIYRAQAIASKMKGGMYSARQNYTLLEMHLFVQRKPLYYVVNLITPTSIITFISIVGFFSSPSINDLRQEKITLGITTLLSMSILVFMVSDKMPSTSSFIPLIGWFYTSMILLISLGTVCASLVIYVQKQGIIGKPPPPKIMAWAMVIARLIRLEKPLLMKQAYAQKAKEEKMRKQLAGSRRRSLWHKVVDAAKDQATRKVSNGSAKLHAVNRNDTLRSSKNSLEVPAANAAAMMFLKKKKSVRLDNHNPTVIKMEDSADRASENGDIGMVNFAISDDDSTSFIDSPSPVPLGPRLPKTSTSASLDSTLLYGVNVTPLERNLVQLEYDWLAAVVERIFLILFIIVFLIMSVGINLLGFYYWLVAHWQANSKALVSVCTPPPPIALLLVLCLLPTAVFGSLAETRLFNDLLQGYNPLERPVANASTALVVKIKMFLQQILDVDEKNQLVSVNAWLSYAWKDYKLQWKPENYGGIQDIRFPGSSDHIWKPDILLYNSAAEDFDSTYKSNLVVYSNGVVSWIPPGVLKFVCQLDVTWFPFDDQMCELKFGSWTFHGHAIDLQIDEKETNSSHSMDLSTYVTNGEWAIVDSPAVRQTTYFKCCPEPYPTVKYFLHIRRRTLYYGFNLIIPSLLISLMTVLGFTLPPDAGEKITLEVTILLAIVFFLSMVSEMTPPTSEAVPLIGVFFSCCMLVVAASVVFTVVILNLHFRGPDTHEMSPLVGRVLLEWLPWILCMSRPGYKFVNGEGKDNLPPPPPEPKNPLRSDLPSHHPAYEAQILLLHAVYTELKQICAQLAKEEREERTVTDWRFAAMVVDRACLILFSLFITVSTVCIMLSAPHIIA